MRCPMRPPAINAAKRAIADFESRKAAAAKEAAAAAEADGTAGAARQAAPVASLCRRPTSRQVVASALAVRTPTPPSRSARLARAGTSWRSTRMCLLLPASNVEPPRMSKSLSSQASLKWSSQQPGFCSRSPARATASTPTC